MLHRTLFIGTLAMLLALAVLYAVTVRRGPMGGRELLAWEVVAHGELPGHVRIFQLDEREPTYPRSIRWLGPAIAHVHAVDVRLRWAYWHEEVVPDFENIPDFDLAE